MFNSFYAEGSSYTSNVKVNAVTGAILKNHPKSWFERFNLNSDRANKLLTEGGHKGVDKEYRENSIPNRPGYYVDTDNPDKDITILQMVICGDMEVMAELVYTKDYEMRINVKQKGE